MKEQIPLTQDMQETCKLRKQMERDQESKKLNALFERINRQMKVSGPTNDSYLRRVA